MSLAAGGLPTFHIPVVPFTLETLYIILPYALILAAILDSFTDIFAEQQHCWMEKNLSCFARS